MDETAIGFWDVWRDHRPKLFRLSLHRTGGHHADAEDALSTAMLRAFEAFQEQRHGLKDMEAWLARILLNTCTDTLRARSRHADAPDDEDVAPGLGLAPPAPSPEQELLAHEQTLLLRRQLEALPEHLRRPCVLRFEQGLTSADIARELGLTAVNVRQRLVLAYRKLRTGLDVSGPPRACT